MTSSSATSFLKIDYTYDSDGNIRGRDYTNGSSIQDQFFSYDGLDRVTEDCRVSSSCSASNENAAIAYNVAGDRSTIHTDINSYRDETYTTNYASGTRQLSTITYDSAANTISYGFDGRGNRLYDDDDNWTTDRRDYTYDARNNLVMVEGNIGYSADTYVMTNAFDHKNRRIFKSYENETTGQVSHWFFYYDLYDRLIETKHVPDTASSSTYTLYQHYYIGDRPIAYWQIDYPSATTTKRYIHSDQMNRPLEVFSWETWSGSQWHIKPDVFGWDGVSGSTYQPLRFPGQYWDEETLSWATYQRRRPALRDNRYRTYDAFTGGYMQVDPKVDST